MVTRDSATGRRCSSNPALTIQIDENHSEMVKFARGDHRIDIMASKLCEICGIESATSQQPSILRSLSPIYEGISDSSANPVGDSEVDEIASSSRGQVPDAVLWNNDGTIFHPT